MTYLFRPQNPLGNALMEPTNGSVDDLLNIIVMQKISEPAEAVSCGYFDHNPRPNKRQHTAPMNWTDLDVSDDELKTLTTSGNTKVRPSPQILQPIQEDSEVATFVSTDDQPLPFDGMEFHTTTTIADDSYETRRKFLKRRASTLYENDNTSQVNIVNSFFSLIPFLSKSFLQVLVSLLNLCWIDLKTHKNLVLIPRLTHPKYDVTNSYSPGECHLQEDVQDPAHLRSSIDW